MGNISVQCTSFFCFLYAPHAFSLGFVSHELQLVQEQRVQQALEKLLASNFVPAFKE